MQSFIFFIDTDADSLEPGGYVRAADASDAFRRLQRNDATLVRLPPDFDWPASGVDVIWDQPI